MRIITIEGKQVFKEIEGNWEKAINKGEKEESFKEDKEKPHYTTALQKDFCFFKNRKVKLLFDNKRWSQWNRKRMMQEKG